jgi:hypothetical protein
MSKSGLKKVVVTVGSDELTFNVGLTAFNEYQNEFLPQNKVAPSENFLTKCVESENKEKLLEICDQGFTIELANMVASEFKPALELKVKK